MLLIQKKVEDVLAEEILSGNYKENDKLCMDYRDDKIIIEKIILDFVSLIFAL